MPSVRGHRRPPGRGKQTLTSPGTAAGVGGHYQTAVPQGWEVKVEQNICAAADIFAMMFGDTFADIFADVSEMVSTTP